MRISVFAVVTLANMIVGGSALACPVGSDDGAVRRPIVQPISTQASASELFERASRLESSATAEVVQARTLEQEADTLASRARMLRNQASFVSPSDRASIFAIADELLVRSSNDRVRAVEDRARAESFRLEAQALRQRALVLVRTGAGGGGWRKRSPSSPESLVVDRGV